MPRDLITNVVSLSFPTWNGRTVFTTAEMFTESSRSTAYIENGGEGAEKRIGRKVERKLVSRDNEDFASMYSVLGPVFSFSENER